jgi:hypothetical protein
MMEIGNPGLTAIEAQSHFSMWAISAAPLWAGNDLTEMTDSIRSIYTNAEAIAVDQDSLGAGAWKVRESGNGIEVWMKPLETIGGGVDAVLLLNLATAPAEAAVQWSDLGLEGKARVRDLWTHKDLGTFLGGYTTLLPAHGSVLLKVSGKFSWIRGASYEAEWPGNIRGGDAMLAFCAECSQGYSVSLRGANNGSKGSSLTFMHIGVPRSGRYWMNIVSLPADAENKTAEMRVNKGQVVKIQVQGADSGTVKIPVDLNKGDNSIALRYTGTGSVDIDRLIVNQ